MRLPKLPTFLLPVRWSSGNSGERSKPAARQESAFRNSTSAPGRGDLRSDLVGRVGDPPTTGGSPYGSPSTGRPRSRSTSGTYWSRGNSLSCPLVWLSALGPRYLASAAMVNFLSGESQKICFLCGSAMARLPSLSRDRPVGFLSGSPSTSLLALPSRVTSHRAFE